MATKQIAWNTGNGNITLTYQGQGNGTITVESDQNDLATVRSQTITVKTTRGGLKTKNLTITQGACPVPVGTVLNYAYTGNYQEVTLPAGQYKLQVWGAQGGSNAAASSYSITAKAGGKGGYSEGVITLSKVTKVRVYVGGAGTSSAGGFNGGGSTTGASSFNSSYGLGVSRMGGGGGATDIRLSDGALLSRMIVAGGGSGGAMTSLTANEPVWTSWDTKTLKLGGANYDSDGNITSTYYGSLMDDFGFTKGKTYKITSFVVTDGAGLVTESNGTIYLFGRSSSNTWESQTAITVNSAFTVPTSSHHYALAYLILGNAWVSACRINITFEVQETQTKIYTEFQVGYVGGGANGDGYNSSYYGKQNSAGDSGSFGQGANQTVINHRYASGAGGGGWYGGGMNYADNDINVCKMSGGGSGFVNTAANAGYRPSGYTGLELDSGETKAGNTSFPNTAGTGNETGHAGNGYARITRLA